jgi:hypothetical protein
LTVIGPFPTARSTMTDPFSITFEVNGRQRLRLAPYFTRRITVTVPLTRGVVQ